ncbi:MAG: methionyl-tRNA formyltransferase [Elusimicrobia bacterium]|nr:methionyl-tRNA formyltransferase [Elusimicrobiota bacterium]
MRLLFLGSPSAAVPFLEACLGSGHEVVAVVTQPDRPAGRGLALRAPAVKEAALAAGLRVLQPERPSAAAAELAALGADLAVVVAYGRILRPDVLAATRHGFMNVHFSLLPRSRGAAPVQWTLLRGEREAGVTLFWLDEGMDTGPVQRMASCPVAPEDDAASLMAKLTALGVRELGAALADVAAGRVVRTPQSGEPTAAPKLTADLARIGFEMTAREIQDRVRGLALGPAAWFEAAAGPKTVRVKLTRAALAGEGGAGAPGVLVAVEPDGSVLIQCRVGVLRVREVQPEGKKKLPAADFINGLRLKAGQRLWRGPGGAPDPSMHG